MAIRRRTDPADGDLALDAWARDPAAARRAVLGPAVRHTLELLAEENPGGAVEVRVPPHGAVQALTGTRHTRGTPPAVVEMDAATWLGLVVGDLTWDAARTSGAVSASGERSDLSGILPLPGPRRRVREARKHAAATDGSVSPATDQNGSPAIDVPAAMTQDPDGRDAA